MMNDFKAWDKNKKQFIPSYLVAVTGEGEIYIRKWRGEGFCLELGNRIDILEFSGKRDRTGAKLYKGDLVRVELDAMDDYRLSSLKGLPEKVIIGVVVIRPSAGATLLVKKIIPKGVSGIAIGRAIRIDQSQDIRIGDIYTTPELIMEEVEEE